jgi:hypothetical protein
VQLTGGGIVVVGGGLTCGVGGQAQQMRRLTEVCLGTVVYPVLQGPERVYCVMFVEA